MQEQHYKDKTPPKSYSEMSEEERKKEVSRMNIQKAQQKSSQPPWMQAEKISTWEKLEIFLYKFVSIFPVFVTFGLYLYFFVFYIGVS